MSNNKYFDMEVTQAVLIWLEFAEKILEISFH